jgi:hypothetical protein
MLLSSHNLEIPAKFLLDTHSQSGLTYLSVTPDFVGSANKQQKTDDVRIRRSHHMTIIKRTCRKLNFFQYESCQNGEKLSELKAICKLNSNTELLLGYQLLTHIASALPPSTKAILAHLSVVKITGRELRDIAAKVQ